MLDVRKIAIVYDWIDKWGGVERILLNLQQIFPEADFYTSYFDSEKAGWAKNLQFKTSFIQNLPSFVKGNRVTSLPFYPFAFESFNFSDYDLVISVTSSFAKSIITRPETYHLCYLLTPTRYLWVAPDEYLKNRWLKLLFSGYLAKLRSWDFIAAQRPDKLISISRTVAERCGKYYQRESEVIYPPFDIDYWADIKAKIESQTAKLPALLAGMFTKQKYLLSVSRLESYKKVDLIIQSVNLLKNQKLIIVGEGSQLNNLQNRAGENIIFLNKVSDEELGYLYSQAEALIMPQEEDFGYVPLEAQFFGCPVLAFKRGGSTETIIDGKTGLFFADQTIESIQAAIKRFFMVKYILKNKISRSGIDNVKKFSREKFEKNWQNLISNL